MSRPNVEHLVGTRQLHGGSAVLSVPFDTKVDNYSGLLLESLAAMSGGAKHETWWVYRLSSWLYPSRPAELAVVDETVQDELDEAQNPDFWGIRRAHVGHMAITTVGLSDIRVVADAAPAITTTEQTYFKPTLLEVRLQPDDKAYIRDTSPDGTNIFADWSGAFADQNYVSHAQGEINAKILAFPSKSTS